MLSLENDVGPFLAMCVATQYHGVVTVTFKGREGIVTVNDEAEMRRSEEIHLRMRNMGRSAAQQGATA